MPCTIAVDLSSGRSEGLVVAEAAMPGPPQKGTTGGSPSGYVTASQAWGRVVRLPLLVLDGVEHDLGGACRCDSRPPRA
jgi:hypothetical protein